MKRTLIFIILALIYINVQGQNQIQVKKATVTNYIIYKGDSLAVWEDSLGNVYNRNTGDLMLQGQVFAPDIEPEAGAKFYQMVGYGLDGRLFPRTIIDWYDAVHDSIAKKPTPYSTWVRDSTAKIVSLANNTDEIKIGNYTAYARIGIGGASNKMNRHGFEDWQVITPTAADSGYATFDARTEITGALDINHFVAFQCRNIYSGSGNLTNYMQGIDIEPTHSGAGTITNYRAINIDDMQGAGPLTNNYGLYINNLSRGTAINYSIYSNGGKLYFGGSNGAWNNPNVLFKALAGNHVTQFQSAKGSIIQINLADSANLKWSIQKEADNDLSIYDWINSKTPLTLKASGNIEIIGKITASDPAAGSYLNPNQLFQNAAGNQVVHFASKAANVVQFTFLDGATHKWSLQKTAGNDFQIYDWGGTTPLTIKAGGRVGIHTASPDSLFTVTGSGRFSANLKIGGNLNISGNAVIAGSFKSGTGAVADGDTTPDVAGYNTFIYAGSATASTTVTDLDNPVVGAYYTFIGNSNSYALVFGGANFKMTGSSPSLGVDDNITFYCLADNYYIEISRSNNNP